MQRNSVVLPEPLGPMIDRRSPRDTSRLMPCRTGTAPKLFFRSMTWTRGFIDGQNESVAILATPGRGPSPIGPRKGREKGGAFLLPPLREEEALASARVG